MKRSPLDLLRLRLTAWYVGTFALIIALLGVGVFIAIRSQFTNQLDRSLRLATSALIRAAHTREMEKKATSNDAVVDAVVELRIPERRLFLLDGHAQPVVPNTAPASVVEAAQRAIEHGIDNGSQSEARATTGENSGENAGQDNRRYYAERFALTDGTPMVAVVSADDIELQERYASLILTFGGATLAGLILTAAGGWLLVRKATVPIEENIDQMRQFMADAAHELRTPVTVVRSRAEIALQQPRDSTEYVTALHGIEAEGRRLGLLVDDLLTLARADSGERPLERVRVFLDDLVLDASDAARVVAKAKGVIVEIERFEETPVFGDAALLRQLVMILLDNAVKFTPTGGKVVVDVGIFDGQPGVIVSDTGKGISAEQLPHIFERFYRGDAARTSHRSDGAHGGAGLGLAIAKWICDVHGGAVQVSSVPSEGTKVAVTLPRLETRE